MIRPHHVKESPKEIGTLYDWPGPVFQRRYTSIPVSDEEEAQVARLKYHLSHGCKEGVVMSPGDWPGVHSAKALATGEPLEGHWFDRTREYNARMRGEEFQVLKYVTPMWNVTEMYSRGRVELRKQNGSRSRSAPKSALWPCHCDERQLKKAHKD